MSPMIMFQHLFMAYQKQLTSYASIKRISSLINTLKKQTHKFNHTVHTALYFSTYINTWRSIAKTFAPLVLLRTDLRINESRSWTLTT